jgi:hypothetical protein
MISLFIIAIIAAIGMSHIIVDGDILTKWRGDIVEKYKDNPRHWLVRLISCYQCTGLWSGVFMALLLQPFNWYANLLFLWDLLGTVGIIILCIPLYLLITPAIVGFAASYCSMAGAALLNYLDAPAMAVAATRKKNETNPT